MLIEDVKIVFLQIVQELFGLDCHQECSMGMHREFVSVGPPHLKMLLGIGSDPKKS